MAEIVTYPTVDPESDQSNNSASASTLVYSLADSEPVEGGEVDQSQPVLEITAWNNVGEFVYPGDTVTFVITIENKSGMPAYDAYLTQELFNGVPGEFGTAEFDLGTIQPGKKAKLSFGLKLAEGDFLPDGFYHTVAQAVGYAPNGEEVVSNQARTDFEIRWREIAALVVPPVKAKEGEVLAAEDQACPATTKELLPYILLFLLSCGLAIEKTKEITQIIKEK